MLAIQKQTPQTPHLSPSLTSNLPSIGLDLWHDNFVNSNSHR